MNPNTIGVVASAVCVLVAAVYTERSRRRATRTTRDAQAAITAGKEKIEQSRVLADAYAQARQMYEAMLGVAREEVTRLQTELAKSRLELKAEETRSAALEVQIASKQRIIDKLVAILMQHSIPLPALDG